MAFNIQTTLETIRDYIRDNERAEWADIGQRFVAPAGHATFASIYMDSAIVVEVTASGNTRELHTVIIRLYQNAASQDLGTVELNLAKQAELIFSDLFGDYDLGATIHKVDVGGEHGTPPQVSFEDIEDSTYRVANLVIPLVVDDSITAAA